MNRDKITYDLGKKLTVAKGTFGPVVSALLGYVFLGKKQLKDGSFVSTCWLTFCYLPVAPMDTYQISSSWRRGKIPKVYGVDEFIPMERRTIGFDYFQAFSSGLIVWAPIFSLLFFLFIYPVATLIGLFVLSSTFGLYQLSRKSKVNSDLQEPASLEHLATFEVHPEQEKKIAAAKISVLKPAPLKNVVPPKATAPIAPITSTIAVTAAPAALAPKPAPALKPISKQATKKATESAIPSPTFREPTLEGMGRFSGFAKAPAVIPVEVVYEKHGHGLDFLGILNVLLVFGYVYAEGYFLSSSRPLPDLVYKVFVTLYQNHLLSIISFNLGLVLVLFRNKFIGILLIVLAFGIFFGLDIKLWNYLLAGI